MDLAHLRAVTDESLAARAHPHGTVTVGEHYPIPRGVFVGEHTGAVIIDPAILTRLLDIAETAATYSRHASGEWERLVDDQASPQRWEEWDERRLALLDKLCRFDYLDTDGDTP